MRVLTVNTGSATTKLRVLAADDTVAATRDLGPPDEATTVMELARFCESALPVDAIAYRIVHGGPRLRHPVVVDDQVLDELFRVAGLAPLHDPAALDALVALRDRCSDVPAVVCFDTAFHATLPEAAARYALPEAWTQRFGLRRYGFHGLSHAYAARRTAQLLDRPVESLRIVTCHLGSGASLAAVAAGRSVDTTMGFSPLDGLVMATRAGAVDPGILLWLLDHGLTTAELAHGLEFEAGLLGLSGSPDMRDVLAGAAAGDQRCTLALDVYLHRLVVGVAAMTASLGRLDAITFTGGVGEHAAEIRARAAARLGFLGVSLDSAANHAVAGADADVSGVDPTRVLVVHAREDLEMTSLTRRLLGAGDRPPIATSARDDPRPEVPTGRSR
jgi:acetate kinase